MLLFLFLWGGGSFLQVGGFFVLMGGGALFGLTPLTKISAEAQDLRHFQVHPFLGVAKFPCLFGPYGAFVGTFSSCWALVGRLFGACFCVSPSDQHVVCTMTSFLTVHPLYPAYCVVRVT